MELIGGRSVINGATLSSLETCRSWKDIRGMMNQLDGMARYARHLLAKRAYHAVLTVFDNFWCSVIGLISKLIHKRKVHKNIKNPKKV